MRNQQAGGVGYVVVGMRGRGGRGGSLVLQGMIRSAGVGQRGKARKRGTYEDDGTLALYTLFQYLAEQATGLDRLVLGLHPRIIQPQARHIIHGPAHTISPVHTAEGPQLTSATKQP
jgi:hypothetical protein